MFCADETQDRAKREQIVIVLRYATQQDKTWVLREDPVALLDLISEIGKDDETAKNDRDGMVVRVDEGSDDKTPITEVILTGKAIGSEIVKHIKKLGVHAW